MWTLFHLIQFTSVALGCALGMAGGAQWLGTIGGVAGTLGGAYAGFVLGSVPKVLTLRSLVRDLRNKTSRDLRASLYSQETSTPNLVLLELKQRGEDIRSELPAVLNLLILEDKAQRSRGWAALASAFPELAQQIPDYRINDTVAECRKCVARLEEAGTYSQQAESPPSALP